MSSSQITTLSSLQSLIAQMKSSSSFSSRQKHLKSLLNIRDTNLYDDFVRHQGLEVLGKWVNGYKEAFKTSSSILPEEEDLIINIVTICERCNLNEFYLRNTSIGKYINKLGKVLRHDSRAKRKCEEIVRYWKNMTNHDNNAAINREVEENYIGKKSRRDVNDINDSNDYNNHSNTNSNNDTYNYSNSNSNNNNNTRNSNIINNNNSSNATNANKTKIPLKSCLKAKTNTNNSGNSVTYPPKKKLQVQFETEQNLERIKIFKLTDQPNAPNIKWEEYLCIQQEAAANPQKFKIEDIRTKEIKMDHLREPEIEWEPPLKLSIEANIQLGKDSFEKNYIETYCKRILSATYFNKIPEPKEGECKLFAFDDENIPKIENEKTPTYTNVPTIKDVFAYIESLQNKPINKEIINEISSKLEGIEELTQEKKNAIIQQLSQRLSDEQQQQHTLTLNTSNTQFNASTMNNPATLVLNNPMTTMNTMMNTTLNPNQTQFQLQHQAQPGMMQLRFPGIPLPRMTPLPMPTGPRLPVPIPTMPAMPTANHPLQKLPYNFFPPGTPMQPPNMVMPNPAAVLQQIQQSTSTQQQQQPQTNTVVNVNVNAQQNMTTTNNPLNTNAQIRPAPPMIDARMFMESAKRMDITKYKTKPCRNYHSSLGCKKGVNCFFIHDHDYAGVEIPNFNSANYQRLPAFMMCPPQMNRPQQQQPQTQQMPMQTVSSSSSSTTNTVNTFK